MFKIEFKIDDNGIDANEVFGDIVIKSENGKIVEECTYVDTWISTMIDGVHELAHKDTFIADLIEEPDCLQFRKMGKKVELKYKNNIVIVDDIIDLVKAIKIVASQLFDIYKDDGNFKNNKLFIQFYDFLSKE